MCKLLSTGTPIADLVALAEAQGLQAGCELDDLRLQLPAHAHGNTLETHPACERHYRRQDSGKMTAHRNVSLVAGVWCGSITASWSPCSSARPAHLQRMLYCSSCCGRFPTDRNTIQC